MCLLSPAVLHGGGGRCAAQDSTVLLLRPRYWTSAGSVSSSGSVPSSAYRSISDSVLSSSSWLQVKSSTRSRRPNPAHPATVLRRRRRPSSWQPRSPSPTPRLRRRPVRTARSHRSNPPRPQSPAPRLEQMEQLHRPTHTHCNNIWIQRKHLTVPAEQNKSLGSSSHFSDAQFIPSLKLDMKGSDS